MTKLNNSRIYCVGIFCSFMLHCAVAESTHRPSVDELLTSTNIYSESQLYSPSEKADIKKVLQMHVASAKATFPYMPQYMKVEQKAMAVLIDMGDADTITSVVAKYHNPKVLDEHDAYNESYAMQMVLEDCRNPAIIPLLIDDVFATDARELIRVQFNSELTSSSTSLRTTRVVTKILAESPVINNEVRQWAKTRLSSATIRSWWQANKAAFDQKDYGAVKLGVEPTSPP